MHYPGKASWVGLEARGAMMDLFTPLVSERRLHHNFRNMLCPMYENSRNTLAKWADGFIDRDGNNKFVTEFQTAFNSAFWELYLHASLKQVGCSVDFSFHAPDFVATHTETGLQFCVEATTANHAASGTPEWERVLTPEAIAKLDLPQMLTLATVRLANAISSKHAKFKTSYAALPQVQSKPFLLAAAPFDQPFFTWQCVRPLTRVLYGVDRFLDQDEDGTVAHRISWLESVRKTNGADVPLGVFTDGRMEELSGVLFSSTATTGKVAAMSAPIAGVVSVYTVMRYSSRWMTPTVTKYIKADASDADVVAMAGGQVLDYTESLVEGLHLFHNPHARIPFPRDQLAGTGIVQHWWDFEEGTLVDDAHQGALVNRQVMHMAIRPGLVGR